MIERHPAGRSCALVLLIAGILTASALTGLFALATSGGSSPSTGSPVPAAVVVAGTTTPTTAVKPSAAATAPASVPAAAPRVVVAPAEVIAPTEETTVPAATPPATDANGARVAPVNPNANQTPAPLGAANGIDPKSGKPVGPDPAVDPQR